MLEHKGIVLELKQGEAGEFTARIATLGVVDRDGDVTQPGAFPASKDVLVSAYGHGSWNGSLPVGRATIKEQGPDVIATGQFNLGSTSGRDTYEAVKFAGALQEWSYGFQVLDSSPDTQNGHLVRVIKRVDPHEISPVLKGAGIATATLDIKGDADATYGDHSERVLQGVMDLIGRSKSLADLRAKEGRVLSRSNLTRLERLRTSLLELEEELGKLLEAAGPEKAAKEVLRVRAEYLRLTARFNGVAV